MKLQQGDVIIRSTKKDFSQGEKLEHLTLAEGESTGHSHRITHGLAELIMFDKIMHLKVFSETALLEHQEHAKIEIPKGEYEISIVREYDPFEDEIRQVRD